MARRRAGVPPARLAAAERVLALLDLALTARDGIEPRPDRRLGGVDAPLALGQAPLVREQTLLPCLELLRPPPELLVVLPQLAFPRWQRRFAPRQIGLREEPPMLCVLEPRDPRLELVGLLVRGRELVARLGPHLTQR